MTMINGNLNARETIEGGLDTRFSMSGNMTSGVGGTSDYNELENKPSINGVTLEGNVSGFDIGIYPPVNYSTTPQNTFTKWIDGKDIWRVVVPFNTMYNGMTLPIPKPSNIKIERIIKINGTTQGNSYSWGINVPYYHNGNYYIRVYFDGDNDALYFESTTEQSQYYDNGFVIVEYTLRG